MKRIGVRQQGLTLFLFVMPVSCLRLAILLEATPLEHVARIAHASVGRGDSSMHYSFESKFDLRRNRALIMRSNVKLMLKL